LDLKPIVENAQWIKQMELAVGLEQRFVRQNDGSIWGSPVFGTAFWDRYLTVFEKVVVLARVGDAGPVPTSWVRINHPQVSFAKLPMYVGPAQFAKSIPQMLIRIRAELKGPVATLFRVPSAVAGIAFASRALQGRPFALEVVGDPFESLGRGSINHPLRPLIQHVMTLDMRLQAKRASAVSYVTSSALQAKYPAGPGAFTTNYSSISLPKTLILAQHRHKDDRYSQDHRIVLVGTLENNYKGVDTLIQSLEILNKQGRAIETMIIGDGRERLRLESLVIDAGIQDSVEFLGSLAGFSEIAGYLDRATVFVLPSRQEGLPRAMIEAMARALPCIGSNVGGIPELLCPEDMVPANDPQALATKIIEVVSNPGRMERMSARNLAKASEYQESVLAERRTEFYSHLREVTTLWLQGRSSP
jgi:glycosyltransferase involved in cell wall biosynthesis